MEFKTKPFPHQLSEFERQKDWNIYAYLWDRGTGKSKEMLDTAAHLYCTGKIQNLVVIGPKSAYSDWKRKHVPEHLSDDVGAYWVHQWRGATTKSECKELDAFVGFTPGLFKIFALNTEALQYPKVQKYLEKFIASGETMVCIDESHFIKNISALRTKNACKIFKNCKYKRIATGTLMERVEDIYSQFHFLQPGCLGFTRFTAFKSHYCILKRMKFGRGPAFDQVVGYKNLDELYARIRMLGSIINKEDVFKDLPPKIYQELEVELTPEQNKHYKKLEKELTTYINGESIEVNTVMSLAMKLHQITCGVIHSSEGDHHIIAGPNPKINIVKEILDEGQKNIVFCNLSSNFALDYVYEQLAKDYKCAKFYGPTSLEDRDRIKDDFQNGDLQCIVANETMAEGITLTKAKNIIYFSNSYRIIKRDQSEDRAHRYGVEHPVNIIDIKAVDTIDEKIIEALKTKKKLQDMLLGDRTNEV